MPSNDWAASPTNLAISPTTFSHTSATRYRLPPPFPFDERSMFLRLSDSSEVFRLEVADDSLNSGVGVSSLGSGDGTLA